MRLRRPCSTHITQILSSALPCLVILLSGISEQRKIQSQEETKNAKIGHSQFRRVAWPKMGISTQSTVSLSLATTINTRSCRSQTMARCAIGAPQSLLTPRISVCSALQRTLRIRLPQRPLSNHLSEERRTIANQSTHTLLTLPRETKSTSMLAQKISTSTCAIKEMREKLRTYSRTTMLQWRPCMCIPVRARVKNIKIWQTFCFQVRWIGQLSFGAPRQETAQLWHSRAHRSMSMTRNGVLHIPVYLRLVMLMASSIFGTLTTMWRFLWCESRLTSRAVHSIAYDGQEMVAGLPLETVKAKSLY